MAAPTWSIIYVPIAAAGGGVIANGIITMKPAAFYSLIHNVALGGIAAGAGAAAGDAAYDSIPGNWNVGRAAAAPAALVLATATQFAPADVAANTAANGYFTTVFDTIGGNPVDVDNYFLNVILPNFGATAQADTAGNVAGAVTGPINTANSIAYLLLMQYDGQINAANHVNTFYKKYNGGAAASQSGALFNVFNTVNPGNPVRVGGMIRYKKQSKKHRRKYSKGRTARR